MGKVWWWLDTKLSTNKCYQSAEAQSLTIHRPLEPSDQNCHEQDWKMMHLRYHTLATAFL